VPKSKKKKEYVYERDIHEFFELSYANYLVLPRSILQSMPNDWQIKFVKMLEELDRTFEWRREGCWVAFKNSKGRYMEDCFNDYQRGRLQYSPKEVKKLKDKHNKDYEEALPNGSSKLRKAMKYIDKKLAEEC